VDRFRRGDVLAVTALVLFILVCLWPLVSMRAVVIQHDLGLSDLTHDRLPMRVHLGRSLKAGSFPLWIPSIYTGFPFLAEPEVGAAYPPNLLLYGLLPPIAAHNLSVLLPFLISGLSLYLLCRELRLDAAGSLLGAMAFSLSGFFVSHVKHMNMVDAACWIPLILFCIERGVARSRPVWLLAAGGLFGLQILAGHPQISYYTAGAMVIYFAARSLRREPVFSLRLAPWFLAALLLGAGLAAVQILPTLELASLSRRAGGIDFSSASAFPYHLRDVLTFVLPYANGDPGRISYSGTIFWENYGYVGLLPFLLALAATVLTARKSWHTRFFALFGLAAFLLVLGPLTPLYRALFPMVSGLGAFRFPTRYLVFVELSLAVLAAIGWTEFRKRLGRSARSPAWLAALAVGALALTAVELPLHQLRQLPLAPADRWMEPPGSARALLAEPAGFRIFSVGGVESHWQAYKRAGGWQGDLEPYIEQRAMLQPSSNLLWGLASADGYVNLVPTRLASVWGEPAHEPGLVRQTFTVERGRLEVLAGLIRMARLWNVRYLISLWPTSHPDLEPLPAPGAFFVYRVKDVLPRAFTVPGFVLAANDEEARRLLLAESHDFRRTVILHEPPPFGGAAGGPPDGGGGQTTIEFADAHEVRLRVTTLGSSFLVLSDTFYPGWRAEVDGRPAAIQRANITQRAVRLEPGAHEVRFYFRSTPALLGAGISALSALVLGLLLLGERRARQATGGGRRRHEPTAKPCVS
jgi:hypothetical protein